MKVTITIQPRSARSEFREAMRRRAIKHQLRRAGVTIPDAIKYYLSALRKYRQQITAGDPRRALTA